MALLTAYWGLDGIILFLSLIVCAYLFMTRKFNYWKKRGVVEFPPTAFVGNFGECCFMRKSPKDFIKDLYDRTKGLQYAGFYIFDRPYLLIRDPELIKHVLVKDFSYFADRHATADDKDILGNTNLFMIKNPAWKVLRAKLTPIFTSGKLKKMFELMVEVGHDLDTHLESLHLEGAGAVVEFKELCAKYTTDLIGTTAYGLKVNSLNNPDAEFRRCGRKIFDYNFKRSVELSSIFFAPEVTKFFGLKFFEKQSTEFLRSAFWGTITERMNSGIKRNDLIDLLIELKRNYENNPDQESEMFKFEGDNLVAQAAVFFTGGFETSSTAISFTLYELALHLDIQSKLRKEINEALEENNGKITYEMTMKLPYLDMAVAETLRKYPPLPFLDRSCLSNYKVPGTDLVIEKGTPVFVPMIGLHFDPQYFPDPDAYDPERFSEENKKNIPSCVYLPFGDGPHICIGLRLGLLQTKLGLIHVLSKYEVTPCDQTPIPMVQDPKALLTSALGGMYLNMRKITADEH